MKTLLLSVLLLVQQPNPRQLGTNGKPTRYQPGFTYNTRYLETATLIAWKRQGYFYRWQVRVQKPGVSVLVWTDDEWIDLDTDKAFYNARTHQITYYDSVDIVPKGTFPIINVKVSN